MVGKSGPPPVLVDKFLLEPSPTFIYILVMAALALQRKNRVVAIETIWPTKLKILML